MSDPRKYLRLRSFNDKDRQLHPTQRSFGQPLSTNTQQPSTFGRGQLSIPAPTSGFRWGSHLIPTYGRLPSSARPIPSEPSAANVVEEPRIRDTSNEHEQAPFNQRRYPGSALRQVPAVFPSHTSIGRARGQTPIFKSRLYPGSVERDVSSTQYHSTDSTSSPFGIHGHADWMPKYSEWKDIGDDYKEDIPSGKALTEDEIIFCEKYGITFEQELGKGAYGRVWLVNTKGMFTDPNDPKKKIDKKVACKIAMLKTFKTKERTLSEGVQRMFIEVDIQKSLNHKNIVKCEHFFTIPDRETKFPYTRLLIFMELCDGDLNTLLLNRRKQRLSENEAKNMLADVSAGLKYLHDQFICHLDIKVHNIMYVKEGTGSICYKLGDFGVAKQFASEPSAKVEGNRGTRKYMPPEMISGSKKPIGGKPADIYSLGCALAECVVGKEEWESCVNEFQTYGTRHVTRICKNYKISVPCGFLISRMTNDWPTARPTISEVRNDIWLLMT